MQLHKAREIPDMRSEYSDEQSGRQRYQPHGDTSASSKAGSQHAYRKDASEHMRSRRSAFRPPHVHYLGYDEQERISESTRRYFADRPPEESPRSSVDTYASTADSDGEDDLGNPPEYEMPNYTARTMVSPSPLVATPQDFSNLFPSDRTLWVQHDDSTIDGNMNLRLDTRVEINGRPGFVTLFHLRMHDLKNREFSLRRYCRDSGREVCHSARRSPSAALGNRPGLQRSLSNAFSHVRSRSEKTTPTLASLKRNDSGYGSMYSVDSREVERPRSSGNDRASEHVQTNIIRLEFSNYAQVGIKRGGSRTNKRYDFEYWGVSYVWKQSVSQRHGSREVSFNLFKAATERVLASIQPLPLGPHELEKERDRGGWIPPCQFWIQDKSICDLQKDVSDVIVASALIALVDDAIDAHFYESTSEKHFLFPKFHIGLEYVGPRRLINEIMNRRDNSSGSSSHPSSKGMPSFSALGFPHTRTPVHSPGTQTPIYSSEAWTPMCQTRRPSYDR